VIIGKGFICTDLDRKEGFPSSFIKLHSEAMVKDRIGVPFFMYIRECFNIKLDKKTLQWWGKFAVNQTFFNLHMCGHHVMRQIVNYCHFNPQHLAEQNEVIRNKVGEMKKKSTECKWVLT